MLHILALFALPTLAHVPHHTVEAMAIPADLSPTEPWYTVHTPYGVSNLLTSQGGDYLGWRALGGAPTADVLIAAAMLDDGTVFLLSEDRLWWSPDASNWQYIDAPLGPSTIAGGEQLWLSSEEGLWLWNEKGGLEMVKPGLNASYMRQDPGGVVALEQGGTIAHLYADGTWEALDGPGSELYSVLADGETLYVGDGDGTVWHYQDAAWEACGELPPDISSDPHPQVIHLVSDGTRVLAVAAWKGPFLTSDGCESWDDRGSPLAAEFSQTTIDLSFTVLQAVGDRWVIAGWDGIAVSENSGSTWDHAYIMPPDCTRGLAFSPTYFEDGEIYIGANTAGIYRTNAAGEIFESAAGGMDYANIQMVVFPKETAEDIFTLSNHVFWRSLDRGASWSEVVHPQSSSYNITVFDDPFRIWIFGRAADPTANTHIFESADDGDTWQEIEALEKTLGTGSPVGATQTGTGEICVGAAMPATVICSRDGLKTWTQTYQGECDLLTEIIAWPPEAPTRLVFADEHGVSVSDDDGETWNTTVVLDVDKPVTLAQADDGSLFMSTYSACLWRSLDGGSSWQDTGIQFSSQIYVMAPHPDFGRNDSLVVGTHNGTYWIDDAGGANPTSTRWAAYNLVDTDSGYFTTSAVPPEEEYPGAVLSHVQPIYRGTLLEVGLRGPGLSVIGINDGDSKNMVSVKIDGQTAGTLATHLVSTPGVLGSFEMDEGYHHVVITGEGGSGTAVDAVQSGSGALGVLPKYVPPDTGEPHDSADTDDPPIDSPPSDSETADSPLDTAETDSEPADGDQPARRCGCASSALAGGLVWLLAVTGLLGLRRRMRRA